MTKRKKWLIGVAVLAAVSNVVVIAASVASKRFEPYVRQQTIEYLSARFDSDVDLASLHVRLPKASALKLFLTRGRGAVISVEGDGVSLRRKGRSDSAPIFTMRRFNFQVDVQGLFETPKVIPKVSVEGIAINVPPAGERPKMSNASAPEG